MPVPTSDPIVVLGAGPAGMAAALALHTAGHPVVLLERYREARPAGNILNLWPPPIKALELMGVDTRDLGAGCHSTFRNAKGRVRADVRIPTDVVARYGGGFIGMLRPDLYRRMLAAIPEGMLLIDQEVAGIRDLGDRVELTMKDGSTRSTPLLVGADGIDSIVRAHLWGASPKREHRLHIIGGYTFDDVPSAEKGEAIIAHTRTVLGSYTAIRSEGRDGYQWWTLEACDPDAPPPRRPAGARAGARARLRASAHRPHRGDDRRSRAALGHPGSQAAQEVVEGAHHALGRRGARDVAVRGLRRGHVDRRRVLPRAAAGRRRPGRHGGRDGGARPL